MTRKGTFFVPNGGLGQQADGTTPHSSQQQQGTAGPDMAGKPTKKEFPNIVAGHEVGSVIPPKKLPPGWDVVP